MAISVLIFKDITQKRRSFHSRYCWEQWEYGFEKQGNWGFECEESRPQTKEAVCEERGPVCIR